MSFQLLDRIFLSMANIFCLSGTTLHDQLYSVLGTGVFNSDGTPVVHIFDLGILCG